MSGVNRTHRRSSLYYVESVEQVNEQHIALLQYIPINIKKWSEENRDFKWYIRRSIPVQQIDIVREGSYVNLLNNDEGFQNGENDERTVEIVNRSRDLFSQAMALIIRNPEELPAISDISTLYSYHVNVGHGNCSLLVFKNHEQIHIWMIDGSNRERLRGRKYFMEIKHCIDHIVQKFHLSIQPHIEVLMITHAHYDHYSGITNFIDMGMIDSQTLIYLNLEKRIQSHNFNNLLFALVSHGMTIIPPFIHNSSHNIDILYPDFNTFSTSLKINNTSSVYCIRFDGIVYFIFPGDLETEGWDIMNNKYCFPCMQAPKYYAISHHGSINGHVRNSSCRFHSNSLADCLPYTTKTVLMGRNKAFPGIYSPQVLTDFGGRIFYSEKDNNGIKADFLEIDLISGIETWY